MIPILRVSGNHAHDEACAYVQTLSSRKADVGRGKRRFGVAGEKMDAMPAGRRRREQSRRNERAGRHADEMGAAMTAMVTGAVVHHLEMIGCRRVRYIIEDSGRDRHAGSAACNQDLGMRHPAQVGEQQEENECLGERTQHISAC